LNNNYLDNLTKALMDKADPEKAKEQKKYMRNKFEFFGIQAKPRRKATRKFMRKENRPVYEELETVVKKLWQKDEREYQYFAAELVEKYKKEFNEDIIELLEYMITHKSWWDTVDQIAKKLVGSYFKKFPEKKEVYIKKWINSDNIWLQRSCILFQLGYKEDTNVDLLFDIILRLKDIDEFFIQKAIGWALRQYARIEPEVIRTFVKDNELSSLSKREALKHL